MKTTGKPLVLAPTRLLVSWPSEKEWLKLLIIKRGATLQHPLPDYCPAFPGLRSVPVFGCYERNSCKRSNYNFRCFNYFITTDSISFKCVSPNSSNRTFFAHCLLWYSDNCKDTPPVIDNIRINLLVPILLLYLKIEAFSIFMDQVFCSWRKNIDPSCKEKRFCWFVVQNR